MLGLFEDKVTVCLHLREQSGKWKEADVGEGGRAGTLVCLGGTKGSSAFVLNAWKLLEAFNWEKISDFYFKMLTRAALWRME